MNFLIKCRHYVEYAAVCFLETVVCILPRGFALRLGSAIGMLLYLLQIKRRIVERNIAYVGWWSASEQRQIVRRLYRTMGRYAVDVLRRSPPPFQISNYEIVDRLFGRGKGVIAILGHFGNWELLAMVFGKKINDLSVVATPMRNRLIERWLLHRRRSRGVTVIYARHALRRIYAALRRNGMVAVLIDQHARAQGSIAPFLGKPANTVRGIAGLAYRTGCALLPVYALLREDGIYDIMIEEEVSLDASPRDPETAVLAYQTLHNNVISRWVRRYPHHYFGWFHRRFRDSLKY